MSGPLAEMRARAEALAAELMPFCLRLEVAGSIRRERPWPSDIELVAIPRFVPSPGDLFGAPQDALDAYVRARLAAGDWQHRLDKHGRPACGSRYKRLTVDREALDLFIVHPPAQFGLEFVLRTGSAAFSKRCVTSAAFGGFLPDGCQVRDCGIYRGGVLIETPEERDVFAVLGLPWIEPVAREVA